MTTGLANIQKNLAKEIAKIEGDIEAGMLAAVKFVQGEAMEITPVSQGGGTLVNSAFSGAGKVGNKIVGRIGYTAKYAPFVHEMPASNNFTKIGTGPKFLEKPIRENQNEILQIIAKRAKIK